MLWPGSHTFICRYLTAHSQWVWFFYHRISIFFWGLILCIFYLYLCMFLFDYFVHNVTEEFVISLWIRILYWQCFTALLIVNFTVDIVWCCFEHEILHFATVLHAYNVIYTDSPLTSNLWIRNNLEKSFKRFRREWFGILFYEDFDTKISHNGCLLVKFNFINHLETLHES